MRAIYPSDITREQFSVIAYDLQSARKATRPRTYDLYDVFCAVLYVLKEGCTWRGLVNLCLDAGYVVAQRVAEGMGYEAHIRAPGLLTHFVGKHSGRPEPAAAVGPPASVLSLAAAVL
jgi:transposase